MKCPVIVKVKNKKMGELFTSRSRRPSNAAFAMKKDYEPDSWLCERYQYITLMDT
jgi:hypothetical protein